MKKLLFSYLITAFCGWTSAFLLPLIIQEITHSALYTSMAYGIGILPYLIIMPLAGVLGDYLNKKRMIQIGEIANLFLLIILLILPFEATYLLSILCIHFGLSAVAGLHHTIFQAIVPSIVAKKDILTFNAYASSINNLAALVAPALVGIWLSLGTKRALVHYLLGGYTISFMMVSLLPYLHKTRHEKVEWSSIFSSFKEGIHYLKGQPILKYTVINFFFVNFGETFINANLVHYLKHHHKISESELSYYFLPIGLGALLGSMIAPYIMRRLAAGKIILLGSSFSAASAALIYLNQTPWLTTSLWGLNEAGASVVIVTFFTLRQKIVPIYLLSRIVAVTRMTGYLAMPLASMSSGWLFEYTAHFPYLLMVSVLSITFGILVSFRTLLDADVVHSFDG